MTALTREERKQVETEIEKLIAVLDDADGDENLESTADGESSLGWPEAHGPAQLGACFDDCQGVVNDDREDDGGDLEPNLTDSHTDLEGDTADLEWSLGWVESMSQHFHGSTDNDGEASGTLEGSSGL